MTTKDSDNLHSTMNLQHSTGSHKKENEALIRYLEVLLNEFPNQLSQRDLAAKAGVSLSAVTKVKKRLHELCDVYALLDRRFVLNRSSATLTKIILMFLERAKPLSVLAGAYAKSILKYNSVHQLLCGEFPIYAIYFGQDDTAVVMNVLLHNLSRSTIDLTRLSIQTVPGFIYDTLTRIVDGFELPFASKAELMKLLSLRDKFYFLALEIFNDIIKDASIFKTVRSEQEIAVFRSVYSRTAEYYLAQIFEDWTNFLERNAQKKRLPFKAEYKTLGHFFKPKREQEVS